MTEIQGDPDLAAFFSLFNVRPLPSKIVSTDILSTAVNKGKLKPGERFAVLSCRHTAVTRNAKSMICPRCEMLIKHGLDYEGWVAGLYGFDGLVWPEDPCRPLNEKVS